MTLKYYYSLILSLLATLSVSSQQVVVTELPTQRLLPVAHIHRILQDSEGYMWYATEGGGLCRDNGYQINVFRSDLNTPHLPIQQRYYLSSRRQRTSSLVRYQTRFIQIG